MEESKNILEEEIKNRLRVDFFKDYDASPIIGKIDFAVTLKSDGEELFDKEYFLWAEAKRSPKEDLIDSFVQLIITIGKAKTHEKLLPPYYLGAFDKEKIAFIEFHNVIGALYQGDINWNVAPSDHKSDTFIQLRSSLKDILQQGMSVFNLKKDEKTLRKFINKNFLLGKDRTSRINITRNNFMFVFQRWVEEVKPSIAVEWEDVPKTSVVDFFYADLISRDDYTRSEDLAVVLRGDRYKILQQILKSGTQLFSEAFFNDKKVAYRHFWNKYERPPKKDYLGVILERRDLLIPHNLRQYQGAFFTPPQWVQKSQEYLAKELGENWQQEYYIWDCCAGTGNLLYGLTEKYRIWASDLSSGFVQVMKERINEQSLNLLERHIFTFDFLNDPLTDLPQTLQDVINNPEERKKLVVYINPPYAEAADQKTVASTGENKKDVAVSTVMYKRYAANIGIAGRELFAQFLARLSQELQGVIIGNFGTLKLLQGPSFKKFRDFFHAKLCNMFTVPAYTFDNVNGKFPIGFFIWNTNQKEVFHNCESFFFERSEVSCGKRFYISPDKKKTINDWIKTSRDRENGVKIGFMSAKGCDFQNQDYNYIVNDKSLLPHPRGSWVEDTNLLEICVYFAVRHVVQQDWKNNQDQFFAPLKKVFEDDFVKNCLVYTLFSEKNIVQCQNGSNHWIPFSEIEVGAKDVFKSHFMNDYITGKKRPQIKKAEEGELFQDNQYSALCLGEAPLCFSQYAKSVMEAGKKLWFYYHQQPNANPNASYYDIRLYFQGSTTDAKGRVKMNSESDDKVYTSLLTDLRLNLKRLEQQIVPKVYEYGFLINSNELLPDQYLLEDNDQQEVEPAIEITGYESHITKASKLSNVSKKKDSAILSLEKVLKPVSGAANVNITVNINKFEKNVGAVIQTGGKQNINEIVEIKKEE